MDSSLFYIRSFLYWSSLFFLSVFGDCHGGTVNRNVPTLGIRTSTSTSWAGSDDAIYV